MSLTIEGVNIEELTNLLKALGINVTADLASLLHSDIAHVRSLLALAYSTLMM